MNPGKIVIFGAGKIGRSFIGQLFSKAGYEVVFIDVFKELIDELNRRGSYRVVIKGERDEVIVCPARGVHLKDETLVVNEIASASLLAVSVGISGLKNVFPLLAQGLLKRFNQDQGSPLDIILAENLRNADVIFRNELSPLLPHYYPFDKLVGLVETSIGKMVPLMQQKDLEEDFLQVFAEPYNTLILARNTFRNPIPEVQGLSPRSNMKAWVDRKLFIHNLGHAAAAYIGFLYDPSFLYVWEALEALPVLEKVKAVMKSAAEILMKEYPDEFTTNDLSDHIDDLLARFQNRALGDTLYRVGCDLNRKLAPGDRITGAINMAIKHNSGWREFGFVLVCAIYFRARDERGEMHPEDRVFVSQSGFDAEKILKEICAFRDTDVQMILKFMEPLQEGIRKNQFRQLLALDSN